MIVVWFALQFALVVAAVQLMDRRPWRRIASLLAVIAALMFPLYVSLGPLPRAMLAALGMLAVVKVLQVAQAPEQWPANSRFWQGLAPFDIATTRRVEPVLDRKLLRSTTLNAGLALLALLGLLLLPRSLPTELVLLRLLLGAGLAYTAMEAVTEGLRLLHLLAGVAVPPLQSTPILSQSIREFWSQRWNRPVSGWLNEFVFRPVARRQGSILGVLATFAVSGLLHAWMFYVSVGLLAALMAEAFFVFNAVFVLVESAIGIRALAPTWQRTWTLGLLLLSSPLFVEPMLQVLGL